MSTTRTLHFIGNVLPTKDQADAHPESGSKSFHITPNESKQMDLVGLPVRLEHADSLTLGTIQKSWNDSTGRKWVIGEIDDNSVESKFAGKDLLSNSAVFKGLSLQHVHNEYSDGSSSKKPVEVSLVRNPRRPGCTVAVVRASITDKAKYKSVDGKHNDSMSQTEQKTTPEPTETPAATDPQQANTTEESTDAEKTDLMKQVLGFHQANESLEKEKNELQSRLKAMEEANSEREKKQQEEQSNYIKKLTESVMERVAEMSPEYKDVDTTEAISKIAESHPQEVRRVLEIAHCASQKSKELEMKLANAEKDFERKLLEARYNDVVSQKPGVHVNETTTVSASKKRKTESTDNPYALSQKAPSYTLGGENNMSTQQIREAYKGLRGSGSMLDCMKNVGDILGTQRQHGFH